MFCLVSFVSSILHGILMLIHLNRGGKSCFGEIFNELGRGQCYIDPSTVLTKYKLQRFKREEEHHALHRRHQVWEKPSISINNCFKVGYKGFTRHSFSYHLPKYPTDNIYKKIINKKIIYKIMSLEQHNSGNIINYITSHNYT